MRKNLPFGVMVLSIAFFLLHDALAQQTSQSGQSGQCLQQCEKDYSNCLNGQAGGRQQNAAGREKFCTAQRNTCKKNCI
mgnify:CR=1 FL=1